MDKAKEFYVDFLGFDVEFSHRFDDGFPLYMGLRAGDCVLHLSEHHGDCSPGAQIRIVVDDIEALQKSLTGKVYKFARPEIQEMPWKTKDMMVTDPFGNRVTFTTG